MFIPCFQITVGMQTERVELHHGRNRLVSEHQTSDASIGYPPGLTRERFISFARNTINRGILQKHYSRRKRRKPINANFRLLSFINEQN